VGCVFCVAVCCSVISQRQWWSWPPKMSSRFVEFVGGVSVAICCSCCSVLQCIAVCSSTSQCVAVYHSVLQCTAVRFSVLPPTSSSRFVITSKEVVRGFSVAVFAVYCRVLQCIAVCCSVLLLRTSSRFVIISKESVRASVLQCIAVYCSVLSWYYREMSRPVESSWEVRVLQRATVNRSVLQCATAEDD